MPISDLAELRALARRRAHWQDTKTCRLRPAGGGAARGEERMWHGHLAREGEMAGRPWHVPVGASSVGPPCQTLFGPAMPTHGHGNVAAGLHRPNAFPTFSRGRRWTATGVLTSRSGPAGGSPPDSGGAGAVAPGVYRQHRGSRDGGEQGPVGAVREPPSKSCHGQDGHAGEHGRGAAGGIMEIPASARYLTKTKLSRR